MLNNSKIALLCLSLLGSQLVAQNNTKSIYSSYGVGVFQSQEVNGSKGMAGNSLGLLPGFIPNLSNPMSFGGKRSTDFNFGFEFNNRLQQNNSAQRTDWAGSVNHIGFSFPVLHRDYKTYSKDSLKKKRIYKVRYNTSVSLSPFTAMDYDYAIEGDTNTFGALISVGGSGALNSLRWNNAFQFLDTTLTFGVSVDYLFGTITENRLKNLLNDSSSIGYQESLEQRINGTRFGFGLTHTSTLNKKNSSNKNYQPMRQIISALYHLGTNLSSDAFLYTRRTEDFFRVKDTLRFDNVQGNISLPSTLRLGYGIQRGNLWTATLDYTNSALSNYSSSLDPSTMSNLVRYGVGFMLNPDRLINTAKKIKWHKAYLWSAGLFYQTGPFAVENQGNLESIDEYGISFGVGIPMKARFSPKVSYFHLSTQYSRRGNLNNGLIQEDIFRINLAVNLSDIWFKKFGYN